MSQAQMLIGGEHVAGVGAVLEVENPYTEQTIQGLEAFQETKHVHMEPRIEPKSWWYPYGHHG